MPVRRDASFLLSSGLKNERNHVFILGALNLMISKAKKMKVTTHSNIIKTILGRNKATMGIHKPPNI